MGYVNIFSNPYTTTESWSAQGAVVRFGVEDNNFDLGLGLTDPAEYENCVFDAGGESVPLIIAGLDLNYSRQAQQIYPLNATQDGQSTKITIKGAPQGILRITSVYSPVAASIACFLKLASRDCIRKGNEMWMSIRPFGSITCTSTSGMAGANTIDNPENITWRISGVELNQLGLQMQSSQTTIVNMPLNFDFTSLKISDNGDFGGLDR